MADSIQERLENGIAILTLPHVLSVQTCAALDDALDRYLGDLSVKGVVLAGAESGFSSGFDPEERGLAGLAHAFAAVARRIAMSKRPVVAALTGHVRNEGVDLATCAHARVADEHAKLSMNTVDVGLIPGGGATQRLPRLIGPENGLHLMLGGGPVAVTDVRLKGLINHVVAEDVVDAAAELAQKLVPSGLPDIAEPDVFQKALANTKARHPHVSKAQSDVIACVEAAQLLPFDQGLAFEMSRFEERCADPASRLLRHAAIVQAKARQPAPKLIGLARPVSRVIVMGRSSETADLAAIALEHGRDVWIEAGSSQMGRALAKLTLKRVRPSFRNSEAVKARLNVDLTGSQMEDADLIFDTSELIPDPPVTLKEGGIWIVTSPDVAAVDRAKEVQATGQTLRMRRLMRASHLVELSAPPDTADAAIATAHQALSVGDQSVIVTADAPGGLLGALFCAVARASLLMLAAGKQPSEIEQAARKLGLRQGPLQMIDVIGAGRSLAQMRRVYEHRGASLAPLRLLSERMADVTEGDEAKARRALVFHAPAGQSFARDPDLAAWLAEWRADHPNLLPHWPDVDLQEAFLAALVSEAARLIQDKVAARASDIDLAAEKGLLMDARSGGPLIQADVKGLLRVSRVMRQLEPVDSTVWAREPLIDDMVKNGRLFF